MPNIMRDGEIVEISQEELDSMLVDNTDYAAHWRGYRDILLAETDWWTVADRTMTQAEKDYRQALRDITTHPNWPDLDFDDWPTKPE
jgi:hypothetical protein